VHSVTVYLTDNLGSSSHSTFRVIVTNLQEIKPSFLEEPPIPEIIEVMAGVQKIYELPIHSPCIECFVEHKQPLPQFI
jgi:hypothetical protein